MEGDCYSCYGTIATIGRCRFFHITDESVLIQTSTLVSISNTFSPLEIDSVRYGLVLQKLQSSDIRVVLLIPSNQGEIIGQRCRCDEEVKGTLTHSSSSVEQVGAYRSILLCNGL
jgi:hypothetical protein